MPPFYKSSAKTNLPQNFVIEENVHVDTLSDATKAVEQCEKDEFLITLIRCGLPHSMPGPGSLPP